MGRRIEGEDTVERRVLGLDLTIPASSEALLDEEAFDRDEFMPYWAELWPSGIALAEAVEGLDPAKRVLEIGCGLGLPSLVAARSGADVLATDWAADAIALLERNAQRNDISLRAVVWDWRDDPIVLGDPFDLVLASDVLYEERNHPPLERVLPQLVGPGGEVWISDPGRAASESFGVAAGVTVWEGRRRRRP